MKEINFSEMTRQELADYVVGKIVTQGKQCKDDSSCMYSDGKGNHCAVGWVWPDPPSNDDNIEFIADKYEDETPEFILENLDLFDSLQQFHDADKSAHRERLMRKIKADNGIDTSAPHWAAWVDMATSG